MRFELILNLVCGLALGYLGFLVYETATEEAIRDAGVINTAVITVVNGEVFVEPIE